MWRPSGPNGASAPYTKMNMNEMTETKEVAVVKQQATKALTAAQALEIKSDEDMKGATDMLSKMKSVAKMIKDRKEAITKPLNEALASARDLFKPIETNLAEAERVVKGKMLSYQDAVEKKAEDQRVKIAERVERGTMKPETAVAKMADIQAPQTHVEGNVGAVTTRKIKKVRFTELTKLQGAQIVELATAGYLQWNETVARRDALAGKPVPGTEVYEEKVIGAR